MREFSCLVASKVIKKCDKPVISKERNIFSKKCCRYVETFGKTTYFESLHRHRSELFKNILKRETVDSMKTKPNIFVIHLLDDRSKNLFFFLVSSRQDNIRIATSYKKLIKESLQFFKYNATWLF